MPISSAQIMEKTVLASAISVFALLPSSNSYADDLPGRIPRDAAARARIAQQALRGSDALFPKGSMGYSVTLRTHLGALNAAASPSGDAALAAALRQFQHTHVTAFDADARYRDLLRQIVQSAATKPRRGGPTYTLNGDPDLPKAGIAVSNLGMHGKSAWTPYLPLKQFGKNGKVDVRAQPPEMNTSESDPAKIDTLTQNLSTDFPDVVLVTDAELQYVCSGTLIAPGYVLTAKHCTQEFRIARIGIGWSIKANMVFIEVAPPVCMSSDCSAADGPDVALLHTRSVSPTPAQKEVLASSALFKKNQPAIVVGFGQRNVGDEGSLSRGTRSASGLGIFSPSCHGEDVSKFGCQPDIEFVAGPIAGYAELDGDGCEGDSGGPVFIWDGAVRYLAGIVRGPDKDSAPGGCGAGGIFERLDGPVARWIERTIASR